MQEKVVYLMRGLPSSGKSFTAGRLAGSEGLVLETDQFFHSQVGVNPDIYDYDEKLMPTARAWNLDRFQKAIERGVSPIVVDRGNGRNKETEQYARYAVDRNYLVELKEPESEWWQEIRALLKHKHLNGPWLDLWAKKLSELNQETHRVPAKTIRSWMGSWKWDLSVTDILSLHSEGD